MQRLYELWMKPGRPPVPNDSGHVEDGFVVIRRKRAHLTSIGERVVLTSLAAKVSIAVEAYEGRRLKVDRWKPVVAEALGIKKVATVRWQAIVEAGVSNKHFRIADDGSYPYLEVEAHLLSDPTIPEDTGEEEDDDLDVDENMSTEVTNVVPEVTYEPPVATHLQRSESFNPPDFLDCGHLDWEVVDGVCQCCVRKEAPNYQFLKGKYVRPVPEKLRRKPEKDTHGGWPGLCCDKDGFYIGGVGNQWPKGMP